MRKKHGIILLALASALLMAGTLRAQFEEGRAETQSVKLSGPGIAPNASPLPLSYSAQQGETSVKIKNIIWFRINEHATNGTANNAPFLYFKTPFTATVSLDITTNGGTPQTKSLTVSYNNAQGSNYDAQSYIVLNPADYTGFQQVQFKVNSITISNTGASPGWDPTQVLELENEMKAIRYFNLSTNTTDLAPTFNQLPYNTTDHADQLSINWGFPLAAHNNMSQLEYAWVENETSAYYTTNGTLDDDKIFRDNSTRIDVDISSNSYNIPLLYDGDGILYYRVRPVLRRNDGNMVTGPWSTKQTFSYNGHQRLLNWQSSTSFAENGKSKTVIQYFDGTLRGRQTVTKDNSTGNTVVAETIYDLQGRPNVQILPTPTMSTAIQYFSNFNRFQGQQATDNPARYFDLSIKTNQCSAAPMLDTTTGNGQYYSANNPWLGKESMADYIPNAGGYAYTETRYADDPTQRVREQGGVGPVHQIGGQHSTKYFYGKPNQSELDALFGTEVGDASHYFKNMVQDANGQMSVSYVDMHGRTVATALAGTPPSGMADITSGNSYYPTAGTLTANLLTTATNTIMGDSVTNINTLLVPVPTTYNFTYQLVPPILQRANCSNQQVCFDCKYNLQITLRQEGCANTPPIVRDYNNLQLVPANTACGTPMGFIGSGIAVPTTSITFSDSLATGSWVVRKTLTIDGPSFRARRDSAQKAFFCSVQKTISDSIFNVLSNGAGCASPIVHDCSACTANLGDIGTYTSRYMADLGRPGQQPTADTLRLIKAQYSLDSLDCNLACGTATSPAPSTLAAIKAQMLRDMIPYSGQYAQPLDSLPSPYGSSLNYTTFGGNFLTAAYNIFSPIAYQGNKNGATTPSASLPLFRHPSGGNYLDATGAADAGIMPILASSATTPDVFTGLFDASWANQLLPYHPEYQKLAFAQGSLTASFGYADAMAQCAHYAQASSNGYLSPLANDPYFLNNYSTADYSAMNANLNTGMGGQAGLTIWRIANAGALCPIGQTDAQHQTCMASMPANGISPSANTTALKDAVWNSFKGTYLALRNNMVMGYINGNSPNLPTAAAKELQAEGRQLRFMDNASMANQAGIGTLWTAANSTSPYPTQAGMASLAAPFLATTNTDACTAQKTAWRARLLQCEALTGLFSNGNNTDSTRANNIINDILAQMVTVCQASINAANPYGATNTPDNQNNFENIVNNVLSQPQYNISIKPSANYFCNPYTIDAPKPYGLNSQPLANYSSTLDTCACKQFTTLSAAATAAGYNAQSMNGMNAYLRANYNDTLTLPLWNGMLACNEGTTTCYVRSVPTQACNDCIPIADSCVTQPIILSTTSYIPAFLNCGYAKQCISCAQLQQYTADFTSLYPACTGVPFAVDGGTTDAQYASNALWARYINYKTGFGNTASGYAAAMQGCGSVVDTGTSCSANLTLSDRNAQPPTQTGSNFGYQASNSIDFLPGYTSADNDDFTAQILACTPGSGSPSTSVNLALCNVSKPLNYAPIIDTANINHCQQQQNEADFQAQLIVQLRYNNLLAGFDSLYRAKCLSAQGLEFFYATYQPKEYHYTLYAYDQAGNLVKTLPPAAVKPNYDANYLAQVQAARNTGADVMNGTNNELMATQYRFNTLNKPVAQQSPDGGTSHIWYDRLGRIVLSQNAKQAAVNSYSYTLYDVINRVKEVGQTMSSAAINQSISQDDAQLNTWLTNTNTSREQIIRTIFDLPYTPVQGIYVTQQNLRNRVSYVQSFNSYVDLTSENAATATYYTYDPHGNVDTLLQDYKLLAGMNVAGNRFKRMVYDYDLISGKVNQVQYQPGNADAFYHRYSYDAENRLTGVETSRDSLYWVNDANYSYYRHGPLAQLLLGRLKVQQLNYNYTIQGWMKGVNLFGNTQNDISIARNAYSSALGYFGGDYRAISGSAPQSTDLVTLLGSNATSLYNGNIAATAINIPKLGNPLAYSYKYDQLNRLIGLDAYQATDSSYNGLTQLQDFKERLSYDPNGNIKSYLRNGTGSNISLSNYAYGYNNPLSQNQLTSIFDTVKNTTYNYAYDGVGNTIKDDKQGVQTAVWNAYNKLQTVTKTDGTTITYAYGPDLQRVSKTVGNVSEFYVRDATGNMMATYKKDPALNNGDLTLTETYKYGSSLLSINTQQINVEHPATNGTTTFTAGNDGYQITDQNGNTRLVLSDKRTLHSSDGVNVDWYEAVVNTANHFSAFGAISKSAGNVSVLGFNGQRKSTEIAADAQTAMFWEYNGDVGRRWNSDPVVKEYESPYACFGNNPMFYQDKLGDSSVVDKKGYVTHYDKNDKDLRVFLQQDGKLTLIGNLGGTIDASMWLPNLLTENVNEIGGHPVNFYFNVKTYGKWDYKYRSPANKNNDDKSLAKENYHILGLAFYRKDKDQGTGDLGETHFAFNGFDGRAEDINNFHFGVIGKGVHLFGEEQMLRLAGKAEMGKREDDHARDPQKYPSAQVSESWRPVLRNPDPSGPSGIGWPYGDNPQDSKWIIRGFNYYKANLKLLYPPAPPKSYEPPKPLNGQ